MRKHFWEKSSSRLTTVFGDLIENKIYNMINSYVQGVDVKRGLNLRNNIQWCMYRTGGVRLGRSSTEPPIADTSSLLRFEDGITKFISHTGSSYNQKCNNDFWTQVEHPVSMRLCESNLWCLPQPRPWSRSLLKFNSVHNLQ